MKTLIKKSANKNQTSIFLKIVIALFTITMMACKKESVLPVDDELAAMPDWRGIEINQNIANTIDGSSSKPIDIDGDHQSDFDLQFFVEANGNFSISLFGAGNNKVVKAADGMIKSYAANELINSHAETWSQSALLAEKNNTIARSLGLNYTFVGVYFKKDGKMHYGWLSLRPLLIRGNTHTIEIHVIAYEQQENKAIKASTRTDS